MNERIKYMELVEGKSAKGTLKTFIVKNVSLEKPIGWVKWYAPWRKYCFFPRENTVFSADCLRVIEEWLDELTKEKPKSGE